MAPSNSLNGTAGVSSTSEPISETAESMISYGPIGRENQFKQTKISSEEKVKVHQSYSRENDKRKKFMRDNFSKDEKEQLKKDDKKEREKCVITLPKKQRNIKKTRITKEKKQNVITSMAVKKNS